MADINGAVFRLSAEDATKQAFDSILRSIEGTKSALAGMIGPIAGISAALGVGSLAGWAKELVSETIAAEAQLGRLADRAGMTAAGLSSMRFAAAEGGLGLEEVATLSTRLSKALFEAEDHSTAAGKALELLGLDAKDLALLPTAEALQVVAARLGEVREGTTKTAVEMELLGRSGAQAGAFLKALADQGLAAAQVTNEQAEAARQAEAMFTRLSDSTQQLKISIANGMLPSIVALIGGWLTLKDAMASIDLGTVQIGESSVRTGALLNTLANPYSTIINLGKELVDHYRAAEQATKNWGGETGRARDSLLDLNRSIADTTALLDKLNGVTATIEGKDLGFSSAWAGQFKVLTDAVNAGLISMDRYQQLTAKLLDQQPGMQKAAAANAAAAAQLEASRQRLIDTTQNFINKTLDEINALGQSTVAAFRYQAALQGLSKTQTEVLLDQKMRAIDTSNQLKAKIEAETKGWQDNDAAMAKLNASDQAYLDSLDALNAQLLLNLNTMGMSSLEAQRYVLNRQLQAAQDANNAAAVEKLNEALNTLNATTAKQTARDAAQEAQKAWETASKNIEHALENAIYDGLFKKGKTAGEELRSALEQMFRTLVLRPLLQPIAGNMAGLFSGGGGGSGGGAPGAPGMDFGNLFGSFATTGAAVGGFGVGGEVIGGFGAGAGIGLTEMGAAFTAAIPIVGWVIAAGALAYALFGTKDPSQVEGKFGFSAGTSGFEDNASVKSPFGNLGFLDQGTQYFSGDAAKTFDNMIAGVLTSIAPLLNKTQTADLTSKLQGMNFDQMKGTFTTEEFLSKYGGQVMQQVLGTSLGELDPRLKTLMDNFHGTAQEVAAFAEQLLKMDTAVADFSDANIEKVLAQQHETLTQKFADQGSALQELIKNYDGSAEATTGLLDAQKTYATTLLQLIDQIDQAGTQISSMASGATRGIAYDLARVRAGPDKDAQNAAQYTFLQNEAETLRAQLMAATDPAQIASLTQQIMADMNQAYGLETDAQRAANGQQFLDQIAQLQRDAQARLDAARAADEAAAQNNANLLHATLQQGIDAMVAAGAAITKAAGDGSTSETQAAAALKGAAAALAAAAQLLATVSKPTESNTG